MANSDHAKFGRQVMVVGGFLIAGAVMIDWNTRHLLATESDELAQLADAQRVVQQGLARVSTPADSLALTDDMARRKSEIDARTSQLPLRQFEIQEWWKPFGRGTIAAGIGLLAIVGGAIIYRVSMPRSEDDSDDALEDEIAIAPPMKLVIPGDALEAARRGAKAAPIEDEEELEELEEDE